MSYFQCADDTTFLRMMKKYNSENVSCGLGDTRHLTHLQTFNSHLNSKTTHFIQFPNCEQHVSLVFPLMPCVYLWNLVRRPVYRHATHTFNLSSSISSIAQFAASRNVFLIVWAAHFFPPFITNYITLYHYHITHTRFFLFRLILSVCSILFSFLSSRFHGLLWFIYCVRKSSREINEQCEAVVFSHRTRRSNV